MQGFCFALLQYSPHTNVYSAFCAVNATIPHTAQNSAQGFTGAFPAIRLFCRRCVAGASAYTAPAAPRWSVSQRRNTSSTYQIPAPRRTLHSTAQTAYYNNVYKGAEVPACYRSMPARRGQLPPCMDRWQVLHPANLLRGQRLNLYRVSPTASRCFQRPAACNLAPSTRRAARNYWRLSPQLFSGFRPIANRGQ